MEVQRGRRYQHYKGGVYTVVCLATDEATLARVVVYQGSDQQIWTRPLVHFVALVATERGEVQRFSAL
ncbi:DUF1653 domain-containing protein [Patescibacteria group bacterium]|jgi:hypothetical protein|nr:DUF1653 domain-containing protein [Patescibacteria group bacterium]